MEGADQEDQSRECDRLVPTIQVDSSSKLVTIAGSGKTGNPFQLDPHLLLSRGFLRHAARFALVSCFFVLS